MRNLRQDEAFHALTKEAEPQSAYRALEAQAQHFAAKFGITIDDG